MLKAGHHLGLRDPKATLSAVIRECVSFITTWKWNTVWKTSSAYIILHFELAYFMLFSRVCSNSFLSLLLKAGIVTVTMSRLDVLLQATVGGFFFLLD